MQSLKILVGRASSVPPIKIYLFINYPTNPQARAESYQKDQSGMESSEMLVAESLHLDFVCGYQPYIGSK